MYVISCGVFNHKVLYVSGKKKFTMQFTMHCLISAHKIEHNAIWN